MRSTQQRVLAAVTVSLSLLAACGDPPTTRVAGPDAAELSLRKGPKSDTSGPPDVSVMDSRTCTGYSDPLTKKLYVGQFVTVHVKITCNHYDNSNKYLRTTYHNDPSGTVWSSNNNSVLKLVSDVSGSTGTFQGVSGGDASVIWSNTAYGVSGISNVDVRAPSSVRVTPNPSEILLGYTRQYAAKVHDNKGDVYPGTFTFSWSSSNTGVVTVNSSGLASGVGLGDASVTACTSGMCGSASVRVYAQQPYYVTISGPTSVSLYSSGTWTAVINGSGAVAPFTFQWMVDGVVQSQPTQSFSYGFGQRGTYKLRVNVTDANGSTQIGVLDVNVY